MVTWWISELFALAVVFSGRRLWDNCDVNIDLAMVNREIPHRRPAQYHRSAQQESE